MPAPYDVIYMLTDHQTYGGVRLVNRYFFGTDLAMDSNADDLVAEFIATTLPFVVAAQVDGLIHTNVRAVNISNILDFADVALAEPGVNEAEGLPPHDAAGFRASQVGYGLRPAAKRIAGLPEAWQDGGVVDTSNASLTLLAGQLGAPLEGEDGSYYPITVQVPSPFVLPLEVVPGNRDALSWVVRPYVSTQLTRRQKIT